MMKDLGLVLLMAAAAQAQTPGLQLPIDRVRSLAQAEAQLADARAAEARLSSQIDQVRLNHTEAFPDLLKAEQQLTETQAQERTLLLRVEALRAALKREDGFQDYGLRSPATPDRWWRRPSTVQSLGLTADQQKKMDDVFQQFRLKLIDANAGLQKAEATLEPLVSAEPLDESKIAAQIDRVAEARAELEKTNGRMLLGIRKLLTPAQWAKLSTGATSTGNGSVLEQTLR